MKKSLSLLLALLVALSAFAAMPLTAQAETIKEISIKGVFAPAAGDLPDKTVDIKSSGCDFDSVYWYNCTDKSWMSEGETFVQSKEYEINVHVKAKSGSSFFSPDSSITATINGNSASVSHVTMEDPEEYLNISCKFVAQAANKVINSVEISGITEPVAGEKAIITYNNISPYFKITGFQWVRLNSILSTNFVFEENTTYVAQCYVAPKTGYKFSDEVTGTINGVSGKVKQVSGSGKYEQICVNVDFTTGSYPKKLSIIALTGIVEPKIGENPVQAANGSEGVTVESVSWWNNTDGYWLFDSDKFAEGKVYSVKIKVLAADGFKFASPIATVNGTVAEVSEINNADPAKALNISYNFSLAEEETTAPATEPATEPSTDKPTEPVTEPSTDKPTEPVDPGHEHVWGEWKVTTPANNSEDGVETRVCTLDPSHTETRAIPMISEINMTKFKYTYTGKRITPSFTVRDSEGKALKKGTDYTVNYPSKSTDVGAYAVDVVLKGRYEGVESAEFIIAPAKQNLKATTKTKSVKLSKAKKANQKVKNAITVKGAKGKVTYKKVNKGSSKYLSISKTGVITVKKNKKYKKSTLTIKVKVTAAEIKNYESASKTVNVKIKLVK